MRVEVLISKLAPDDMRGFLLAELDRVALGHNVFTDEALSPSCPSTEARPMAQQPRAYEQLLAAPEPANLALLEAALATTCVAWAAAWPELHDIDVVREHDEPRAALDILQCAAQLGS